MSNKGFARATVIVSVLSVLSKIMGFVREQLVAWLFGASGLTDAYVVALAIPTVLTGVISNPVSTAFLPVFASYVARDDTKGATRLASSVITLSVGAFLLAGLAAIPFAPALVRLYAPGFSGHVFDSAVGLTRLFFPAFALPLLGALYKGILNTYKEFTVPGIAPFVQNLCIVGLTALLAPALGVRGLAIATVAGYLAFNLIQVPWVRRLRLGLSFMPEVSPGTKQVANLALPLMVGGLATQLYTLVDKNLASRLAQGSIAALNFAGRIRYLPIDLFVTAVITVVFPALSEMWARKDEQAMGETLITGARFALFVCVPSAVGLAVLAKPVVRIAFERGAFTGTATLLTAGALSVYSLGIVGLALCRIVDVGFYSSQNTWYPVLLALGVSCVNIVCDLVLVGPLGHIGLALANVLASWLGAAAGLILYTKHIAGVNFRPLIGSGLKILLSSAVMGICAWALGTYSGVIAGTGSLTQDIILTFIAVGVSVLVYLACAFILKCEELVLITNIVRRRLGNSGKESS